MGEAGGRRDDGEGRRLGGKWERMKGKGTMERERDRGGKYGTMEEEG